MKLFSGDRHESLHGTWQDFDPAQKIREIVADCEGTLTAAGWPTHAEDAEPSWTEPLNAPYWGASSTAWALARLAAYSSNPERPWSTVFQAAWTRFQKTPDANITNTHGLLFGECGFHLLARDLAGVYPQSDLATEFKATMKTPENELMWGPAGAIIAALGLKPEGWQNLVQAAYDHLVAAKESTPVGPAWKQDMYGKVAIYLGATHGAAGNYQALRRAEIALGLQPRIMKDAIELFERSARIEQDATGKPLTNWPPLLTEQDKPHLLQWCHGAPGVITSFAEFPEFPENLLIGAANLIVAAGPLKKPFGLCHGNAGNALALLKVFKRTGDEYWLDSARALLSHAVHQSDVEFVRHGHRHPGLFTGDLGLAFALAEAEAGTANFPMIDN